MKYISKKLFLIPLISLLMAALAYPYLPEQIAVHFDFSGTPDNYAGKLFVFVIPLISFALTALAEFVPTMDPRRESYDKFIKPYQLLHVLVNVLLLVANLFTILYSLGFEMNAGYIIGSMVGIMLMIIGNYMPKFKQSFFCGIKTPWALADEENWYKTHRFGGKLWVIGGFLFIIIPFLPETVGEILIFVNIFILILLPYLYSYLIFRKKFK